MHIYIKLQLFKHLFLIYNFNVPLLKKKKKIHPSPKILTSNNQITISGSKSLYLLIFPLALSPLFILLHKS